MILVLVAVVKNTKNATARLMLTLLLLWSNKPRIP